MNALASTLLWMSLQVALFSVLGVLAFALLKRRGPTTAVATAATVLCLTLPLALVAISPWPRWDLSKANAPAPVVRTVADRPVVATVDSGDQTKPTPSEADGTAVASTVSVWWQTMTDWLKPAAKTSTTTAPTAAWLTWLPLVLLAGFAICMLRLAVGVWAVYRFRKNSRPIDDANLLHTARTLANEIGSPIAELRETSALRSAATIGWRKPLLLLPAEWRTWTATEQRVVLAHELAHIARQDYVTGLIARLAAAIHFYQPAVLWLGRQLRIQQELAADARAAAVAGNRQSYLTTLAEMALRADETPLPWAARAFLPNTSLLVKRVKWLKRKGTAMEKTLGTSGRWMLIAVLAVVAFAVAGIRGPNDTRISQAIAADEQPKSGNSGANSVSGRQLVIDPNAQPGLFAQNAGGPAPLQPGVNATLSFNITEYRTGKYIPADANVIAAMSPSNLAKLPSIAKAFNVIFDHGFLHRNGLAFSDLDDVEVIGFDGFGPGKAPLQSWLRTVLRTVKPFDWHKALAAEYSSLETKVDGTNTYYKIGDQDQAEVGPCFYMPDDCTVIAGSEEEIRKLLHGEKTMDSKSLTTFVIQNAVVRVDWVQIKKQFNGDSTKLMEEQPLVAMFMPMVEHVKVATLAAQPYTTDGKANDTNDNLGLILNLECDSDAGASQVGSTLEAARTVGLNVLQTKVKVWRESPAAPVPPEQILQINQFFDAIVQSVSKIKVQVSTNFSIASTNIEVSSATVATVLMPAVGAAKEAAMRNESMSKLKELALAMYLYNDVNKHFAPAAIRSADGKPLLSWRVAILPYLGKDEKALYEQFHLNEPWDSEHNKPLLAKMPAAFRDPHEPPNSTNASYFMPTGKGMFGGSETGLKPEEITDGTSQTIMLVDAKREIPWTKPEDIEIDTDPAKPLPKFGGYFESTPPGLFGAAFCDGHVEILHDQADPQFLHGLFTIAGREVVNDRVNITPKANPTNTKTPSGAEVPPGSSGKSSMRIELHRADSEPATGLVEATVERDPAKVYLHPEAELTNADIAEATAATDSQGHATVSIQMTAEGAQKMQKLSEQNLGKPLAIVIDGKVVMAPVIRSVLSTKIEINGNFTADEAEKIANGLARK